MGIDRTRRITFEEVADLYAETRPGYPEQLVDDVIALSGIPEGGRILEIGCGPGNATLPFARRGYSILAVELGQRLAELARETCRDFPQVEVVCSAFEETGLPERTFDLVLSADAFHWIEPAVGYPLACRAAKDSGALAFFWNVPSDPQTDWSREVDRVTRERLPGAGEDAVNHFDLAWLEPIIRENFARHATVGEVAVRSYRWSERITTEHFVKLMRTFSGHRELDEATRQYLYAGIREVLAGFGGEVEIPHEVALFHARIQR